MHPKAQAAFEALCEHRTPEERELLAREVDGHTEALRRAADDNELLPVDLARALRDRLQGLLRDETLSGEAVSLVVGAARYYCSERDHLPDSGSIVGLDDDVDVLNHVAGVLGRPDLRVED